MKSLSDIVASVHTSGTAGATKDTVSTVAAAVFAEISNSLSQGEEVRIHNFGTFSTAERAARTGRNPATGEEIAIAASTGVKFKPSKALKDAL